MENGVNMTMLLGRPFIAMVGAVMDMPKKRISFSYVDKKVFYEVVPNEKARGHPLFDSLIYTNGVKAGRRGNIATPKNLRKTRFH